jgi:indolepyruvate ferredoxin oxidoreductase beta subunit
MEGKSFDLLLAGVGGQGIIFAGQIIMETALQEGFRVYGFEMHGMARRGGAVATHIRFGKEVYSPLVPLGRGQLLVAFEPAEALRHMHFLSDDAAVILNTAPVIPVSVSAGEGSYPNIEEIKATIGKQCENIITLDATTLAEETGNSVAMNVVMLGAMCASGVLSFDQTIVKEVIKKRTPQRLLDINLVAFEKGYHELRD